MKLKEYTELNRSAWNEATLIHQKNRKINLLEKFKEKGYSCLDLIETKKLQELDLAGKHIAHLCCNNGRELLSVLNMGAKSGIGFDISDEAIKEANHLRSISGLDCQFIRTDVYEIDESYYNMFDLVYLTTGALCWLPDLDRFFSIVSNLLKDDGHLMVYEIHPVTQMFETDNERQTNKTNEIRKFVPIQYSYFQSEPWIENSGIDYVGKTIYDSKTNYSFVNKISDILNAIIKNSITILEFNEYDHDISAGFTYLEEEKQVPLSYILIGKKC